MQNFRTLGQPLLGEKLSKQKEREKKNAFNRGHLVLPATPKGSSCPSLTNFSDNLVLGPCLCPLYYAPVCDMAGTVYGNKDCAICAGISEEQIQDCQHPPLTGYGEGILF